MKAARIWRWVTGGPKPVKPAPASAILFVRSHDDHGWELRFSRPCAGLVIAHERAPNFFNRAMQRLLLGIHWKML